jgi:hypothetical protein
LAGHVRCLAVPSPGSQFFSAVRRWLVDRRERRVRRFVQVSAGRCILRGRRLRARVRWAWVRRFRLRALRGRVRVRVVRREGLGSATFRVA